MTRVMIAVLSVALLGGASPSDAALFAFWGTAAKDGYVQKAAILNVSCPMHEDLAISTGVMGACQTSFKPVSFGAYFWDRIFMSFDTSILEGQVVDSAAVKLVVFYRQAANWETNLLTDFTADCISSPLAVRDTSCYVRPDTLIPYSAVPGVGDTLTIALRPTWVNCGGATELVMKPEREADICEASGNNVVKLRTTESQGTKLDPRLYVWTNDASRPRCVPPRKPNPAHPDSSKRSPL
jgi:hypothetical protein